MRGPGPEFLLGIHSAMKNKPIDKIRNSGLQMTLPRDIGEITDMCEINSALHSIGGSAIYRVQLADEIDP